MKTWTMHEQQQQKGAQFRPQGTSAPSPARDGAPAEAVQGREAQDHEFAKQDAAPGAEPGAGDYPASSMVHGHGDNTPTARDTSGPHWDDLVQPVRRNDAPAWPQEEGAEAVRLHREQAALQKAAARRAHAGKER